MAAPALAQVPIVVATTPAEDTAAAVRDPNWKVPRTSWGHPSLEGVYSTDDMRSVPRDRPEEIETREKLTPEEFATRAQNDAERARPRAQQVFVLVEQRRQPHVRLDLADHRSAERPHAGARARKARRAGGRTIAARTAPGRSTRSRTFISTTAASRAAFWARRSP